MSDDKWLETMRILSERAQSAPSDDPMLRFDGSMTVEEVYERLNGFVRASREKADRQGAGMSRSESHLSKKKKARNAAMAKDKAKGMTRAQIAAKYDLSPGHVSVTLRDMPAPKPRHRVMKKMADAPGGKSLKQLLGLRKSARIPSCIERIIIAELKRK